MNDLHRITAGWLNRERSFPTHGVIDLYQVQAGGH